MSFLNSLWNEIIGFFGVNQFLTILQKQDYALLLNYEGIVALVLTKKKIRTLLSITASQG